MSKLVPLIITFLFLSPIAIACSCFSPTGSEEERLKSAFERAPLVFIGKAVEQDSAFFDEYEHETVFETIETLKGIPTTPITTNIWVGCCACGYNFQVGESYLVFAYPHHEIEGSFSVSTCSQTSVLDSEALRRIEMLRKFTNGETD